MYFPEQQAGRTQSRIYDPAAAAVTAKKAIYTQTTGR